jgi:restriction system protein
LARQRSGRTRAAKRQMGAAIQLLGMGLLLAVLPYLLGNTTLAQGLRAAWPLGLIMALLGAGMLWMAQHSNPPHHAQKSPAPAHAEARPEAFTVWSAEVFHAIEWRRFEAVVELLFQQDGHMTRSQSHGADGGVDIWLCEQHQPHQAVGLVQCKHWQDKRVGVDKVRELRGAMAAQGIGDGWFATTSTFTPDAIAFARDTGITLLDMPGLLSSIAQRPANQQQALLDVALTGDYRRPTCVNCGVKMVERTPREGGAKFWGCASYPRCKTTLRMRGA